MRSRWGWDLGAKQGMPAVHENADMVKAIEAGTALGPFGGTSDIAVVVASLASDEGLGDGPSDRSERRLQALILLAEASLRIGATAQPELRAAF